MQRAIGRFRLGGVGHAVPAAVLSNEQLAGLGGLDAEAIERRTGIRERHVASARESVAQLGARAAAGALRSAGVPASSVDLLILSTYTPDHPLCPSAPTLASRIGATRAGAFDVNGACSGGVTALLTACSLLATGVFSRALVVSADLTTKFLDPTDPKSRLIFGDGAAALLLDGITNGDVSSGWQVLAAQMGADGRGAGLFQVPAGGAAYPHGLNGVSQELPATVRMDGRSIFRFGVERGAKLVEDLLTQAELAPEALDWVIPHQANLRIIHAMQDRCPVPPERWVVNIDRYGNTASASVMLALAELSASGRLEPGQTIALAAFGAGLTWSGLLARVG
jgi:3-oxoacyl-[acyl-carrier-protein] synthase-3